MTNFDYSYEASQVRRLGSLDNGGTIKLITAEGETHILGIGPDKLKRIAEILADNSAALVATPATRCGCEHLRHFPEDGIAGDPDAHAYMGADAGEKRAFHVGLVCDDCASTCMAGLLVVTA